MFLVHITNPKSFVFNFWGSLHLCMSIFCCNFAANLFYMESTPIKTPNGWRRPLDPMRHHRETHWDYKGRGIYHITLVVAEHYPLLGHLTGEKPEEAHIELTEYGEQVLRLMRDIPDYYAPKGYRLKIIASQVMPDTPPTAGSRAATAENRGGNTRIQERLYGSI